MFHRNLLPGIALLITQVLSQAVDPSAPPVIVSQHAQDILSADQENPCTAACAELALKLPAENVLFTPNEINYIWSAQQGELTPACRVLPDSAEEVSTIFRVAKRTKCHFAVKSGGHSQHAGASTASEGITIDLARMNKVNVSKDRKSVYVGAGSQWLDVYTAVEAEGLLVVGGRVADVGVGGLLTGGGISLLSNKHGWGCDNILSYEVVLPDTSITTVDQKHHLELYRALKGAGMSNFGIITSFTLAAIEPANPQGFWTGITIFDETKSPIILDEQEKMFSKKIDSDSDIAFLHAFVYDAAHDAKMAYLMHFHGSHADPTTYPEVYEWSSQRSSDLKPLMDPGISIKPYSNVTRMIFDTNPPTGKRNLYVSFTYKPSRQLDERMTTYLMNEIIPKIRNVKGILPAMVMQPIYAQQRRSQRGGNSLGLDDETSPLNLVLLPWTWELKEDEELITETLKEVLTKGETWAKELGVYHPYIYANYAGPWQDIWKGYGAENVKQLRSLQRKYDPEQVFTSGGLCGGGFKLNSKDESFVGEQKVTNGQVKDEL